MVDTDRLRAITDAQAIIMRAMGGTLKGWYLNETAKAYLHHAFYHLQDEYTATLRRV